MATTEAMEAMEAVMGTFRGTVVPQCPIIHTAICLIHIMEDFIKQKAFPYTGKAFYYENIYTEKMTVTMNNRFRGKPNFK